MLATLFLLSHAKLLRIIITALSYTVVFDERGSRAVWSADGNLNYLSHTHLPLFVVAVVILCLLWVPYTLFIFLGQWLHKCNSPRCLHQFLDAHYCALKDQHQYWFGVLHFVRAALLLVSSLTPSTHDYIIIFSISLSSTVLMYYGHVVYQKTTLSFYNTAVYFNLTILCAVNWFTERTEGNHSTASYIFISAVFIQFFVLAFYKLFTLTKCSGKMKAYFHRNEVAEDDWELYEQAALEREREREAEAEGSDNDESDEFGSHESLATYGT